MCISSKSRRRMEEGGLGLTVREKTADRRRAKEGPKLKTLRTQAPAIFEFLACVPVARRHARTHARSHPLSA